ncbi:MAG: hypothetical protein A2579_02185 [Lysobacterales bacterium RIFOXYD1_FULL_69_11]|nr:MAG: hypothetical protein A2190_05260 [Xanthomonadales bacterium RIFOXYA1_FULL_69_10]OHE88656.1 MAG: hypothetical protein A2579_02185 [Xanthomonadales bacterium RIFOXYD1_FULL_69_11]
MSTITAPALPKSFWIIATIALLWNLLGLAMFAMQVTMSPESLAALPAEQRQVYEATPMWINAAFGVAVVAGVLGAIALLMRRRWAAMLFAISLVALVVQILGAFLVTPAWAAYGAAGLVMPLLLLAISAALWSYARKAAARGWLR